MVTAELKADSQAFARLLASHARKVAAGTWRLKIPNVRGAMKPAAGRHFHFMPEVFIQTGGWTNFDCPEDRLRLMAGEIAVIPVGIPHGETARPWKGPFQNFVVMHTADSVSWHAATASDDGRPRGLGQTFIQTPAAVRLVSYLNDLVEAYHGRGPGREGSGSSSSAR